MEITLTKPQAEIFNSTARYRVGACGRRFGKSILGIVECLKAAYAGENKTVWYVSPTYGMSKMIIWEKLKELSRDIMVKKHETELWVQYPNGSRITLKGAADRDSLRGASLSFLVLDEYASMDPKAWELVLRPACADQRARVLFIGSPAGLNGFYSLWLQGEDDENYPDWKSWQYTTAQGGNVHPDEIEAARREMDERTFKQEFEATFADAAGKIIYNFHRNESVKKITYNGGDLHIGIDFNLNPMTACVAQIVGHGEHRELEVFKEYVLNNSNTEELARVIRSDFPNQKITAYPDPSGRSGATNAKKGQTNFSILESDEFRFKCVAPKRHGLVLDGINDLNSAFLTSAGIRRVWVDPSCEGLVECLDRWCYNEGTDVPDKHSGWDHQVDGIRYMVSQIFPIAGAGKVSVQSINMW